MTQTCFKSWTRQMSCTPLDFSFQQMPSRRMWQLKMGQLKMGKLKLGKQKKKSTNVKKLRMWVKRLMKWRTCGKAVNPHKRRTCMRPQSKTLARLVARFVALRLVYGSACRSDFAAAASSTQSKESCTLSWSLDSLVANGVAVSSLELRFACKPVLETLRIGPRVIGVEPEALPLWIHTDASAERDEDDKVQAAIGG
eukprot:5442550-Amphidinium_carterae.1